MQVIFLYSVTPLIQKIWNLMDLQYQKTIYNCRSGKGQLMLHCYILNDSHSGQ